MGVLEDKGIVKGESVGRKRVTEPAVRLNIRKTGAEDSHAYEYHNQHDGEPKEQELNASSDTEGTLSCAERARALATYLHQYHTDECYRDDDHRCIQKRFHVPCLVITVR
jgi:hypothetical protein